MVTFPKECKGCHLEYYFPHSGCEGCENGSKNRPLMKSHADQINEILDKYKKELHTAITVEAKYGILFDFMTAIDECINAEG
jgi:hypothetical protein